MDDVHLKNGFKVISPDTLFMRCHVGSAEDKSGKTYQLSTSISDGSPIVEMPDKHAVHIGWEALILIAEHIMATRAKESEDSKRG